MKKQILALAVAAGIAAIPAAASAEAILYGSLNMTADYIEQKREVPVINRETGKVVDGARAIGKKKGWGFSEGTPNYTTGDNVTDGGASYFGLKGSEDLYDGSLKAIYQVEVGVPRGSQDDTINLRNTYVGLSSDLYGTFLMASRYDSPLKIAASDWDQFGDTLGEKSPLGFQEERYKNVVAYITPDLYGFQLAGATIIGNHRDQNGDPNPNADSMAEGWSVAATYGYGPFKGFAGYEAVSSNFNQALDAARTNRDGADVDPKSKVWTVGLGIFDWEGFTFHGAYEEKKLDWHNLDTHKERIWQLGTAYQWGNTKFKGAFGQKKIKNDPSSDTARYWAVGIDQFLSERTVARVAYASYKAKNKYYDEAADKYKGWDLGDWNGVTIGLQHDF